MAKSTIFGMVVAAILVLLAYSVALGEYPEMDTTKVREVSRPGSNLARALADIPGEIVKLPVRAIRFLSYTISTNPPVSYVMPIIDFTIPARRYIPIVGYSREAGLKFGFGLRRIKKRFWDERLYFKWYYSTNDYQSYLFRFRSRGILTDWVEVDLYFRYKKRTRESFYGIGMDSQKEKMANYTFENTEFRADIPLRIQENMTAGVTGGYIISNLYDGRSPDLPGQLDSIMADPDFALEEGRLDGSRYITAGVIFEYDGRNHHGQPSRGFHILSRFIRYLGTDRSADLGFYETKIDIRHYLNVWHKRILAARFYIQRFDADNNNDRATPIYMTSRIGGPSGPRGYAEWRFIDNDLALASAEWRFPLWDRLDGFIFLDEGRVFDEITDSEFFKRWQYSAGFGLRVWNVDEVSFSAQVARSDEDTRFYVESGITW